MLILSFILATIVFFLQGVACLPFSLTSYAPFLSLLLLSRPLSKDVFKNIVLSCFIGAFLDFFADAPLGLYALSYPLTSAFLIRFRKYFSYEKPPHLALFSLFFSFTSSFLQIFFFFLFDRRLPIQGQWIFIDRLGVAFFDGIYALVWHAAPLLLWSKAYRKWALFWLKKDHSRI